MAALSSVTSIFKMFKIITLESNAIIVFDIMLTTVYFKT